MRGKIDAYVSKETKEFIQEMAKINELSESAIVNFIINKLIKEMEAQYGKIKIKKNKCYYSIFYK